MICHLIPLPRFLQVEDNVRTVPTTIIIKIFGGDLLSTFDLDSPTSTSLTTCISFWMSSCPNNLLLKWLKLLLFESFLSLKLPEYRFWTFRIWLQFHQSSQLIDYWKSLTVIQGNLSFKTGGIPWTCILSAAHVRTTQ